SDHPMAVTDRNNMPNPMKMDNDIIEISGLAMSSTPMKKSIMPPSKDHPHRSRMSLLANAYVISINPVIIKNKPNNMANKINEARGVSSTPMPKPKNNMPNMRGKYQYLIGRLIES